jgi:hypothetical protein
MNTLFQKMRNNRVKIAAANKYALKRWDEAVERELNIRWSDISLGNGRFITDPNPKHKTIWYKPSTWF